MFSQGHFPSDGEKATDVGRDQRGPGLRKLGAR